MAYGKANSKGDGAWKSGYIPQGDTPTQEADFISLLAARVREQVEEMDIDIAIHALMQTHDENTLKAAMLDPVQARGIHIRHMLQAALPKFLDQERRVTLRPTFISQALNGKGELEGLMESPCPVSQLPQVIQEALA